MLSKPESCRSTDASLRVPSLARLMLTAGCLACAATAVAQPAPCGEQPVSFGDSTLVPLDDVDIHRLPPVDVATLLAQDAAMADSPVRPDRIGANYKVDLSTANSGTWEDLSTGGQVWRLRVQSLEALWVKLGFGTYRLQEGACVWVYDEALNVHGRYSAEDEREHGQLWTFLIEGDVAIVEIFWPETLASETPNIHLGTFTHGYRPPTVPLADCEEDCSPDTSCPLDLGIETIKRGVVRLYIPVDMGPDCGGTGIARCSGSLINHTGSACTQYVLTAAHCVTHAGLVTGTSFLFNYERPECCDGLAPTDDEITGAILRAQWDGLGPLNGDCIPGGDGPGSDFALLELDVDIPASFNARLNGWSRSGSTDGETGCIHIPSGSPSRKVSVSSDGFNAYNDEFWRVADWEIGNTKSGSSGAPLFNDAGRIIGVLSGGAAPVCPGGTDYFGRFDAGWLGGGTSATRLKDWLDPANTGLLSYYGAEDPSPLNCVLWPFPDWIAAPPDVGGDGAVDPGETVELGATLRNMGGDPLTGLTGTLETTTPGVTIVDAEATWPDIPGLESRETDAPFTVHLAPSVPCGTPIDLTLAVTGVGGEGAWFPTFALPVGTPTTALLSGFDTYSQQSIVGSNVWTLDSLDETPLGVRWLIPDIATTSDTVLNSAMIAALPANARLLFRTKYDTENNYGGGMVEISVNGGDWTDAAHLITAGGYVSGMGGAVPPDVRLRGAWGGDSAGWRDVDLDLSELAGQGVQFRWRFVTDDSTSDVGWWIDDAVIEFTEYDCRLIGDLNCDGVVNFFDIEPFVLAVTDPDAYVTTYPDCDIMLADCNGDGAVDFFDIDSFVALITSG